MPIIANTSSANTFSAVRSQLNSVTKRLNQFAVNESAFYANTITANTSLRISGTLLANSSAGTSGHYLRTSGTGVYWSPASGGSSSNNFSGILVGSNVVVADSSSDRLTFVAGSGISIAANPTTDTITFSSTASAAFDYGTAYALRSISF
jgi:hypothetical protein